MRPSVSFGGEVRLACLVGRLMIGVFFDRGNKAMIIHRGNTIVVGFLFSIFSSISVASSPDTSLGYFFGRLVSGSMSSYPSQTSSQASDSDKYPGKAPPNDRVVEGILFKSPAINNLAALKVGLNEVTDKLSTGAVGSGIQRMELFPEKDNGKSGISIVYSADPGSDPYLTVIGAYGS